MVAIYAGDGGRGWAGVAVSALGSWRGKCGTAGKIIGLVCFLLCVFCFILFFTLPLILPEWWISGGGLLTDVAEWRVDKSGLG